MAQKRRVCKFFNSNILRMLKNVKWVNFLQYGNFNMLQTWYTGATDIVIYKADVANFTAKKWKIHVFMATMPTFACHLHLVQNTNVKPSSIVRVESIQITDDVELMMAQWERYTGMRNKLIISIEYWYCDISKVVSIFPLLIKYSDCERLWAMLSRIKCSANDVHLCISTKSVYTNMKQRFLPLLIQKVAWQKWNKLWHIRLIEYRRIHH